MWKVIYDLGCWWVEEENYRIGPFDERKEAFEAALFMYREDTHVT